MGLGLLAATAGCATLSWYGQAAHGQLDLLARREHISELVADPATDPELAEMLEQVLVMREFAVEELALPPSRSYRHYADLERPAAVWNVIAAPAYSVSPQLWCYPIAGCVAYRGYFSRERAERQAAELRGQGLDVIVAPATAYSTLGWFADPVLNTMLAWDEARLAGYLFHELAHEALYVKGDSAFNEAYATVVERVGVERWLKHRALGDQLEGWRGDRIRAAEINTLLLQARERLAEGYRDIEDPRRLAEFKQAEFRRLAQALEPLLGTIRPLNNADLALIATYEQGAAAFSELLEACRGELACYHRRAAEQASLAPAERASFIASAGRR